MIKKFLIFVLITGLNAVLAASNAHNLQSKTIQQINSVFSLYKKSSSISQENLPAPYDYLLTQPLMTKGIETYYRRTASIQTLYALKNQHNNTYHRTIRMFIDKNRIRNDANLAQKKNEALVVELAFITMNFNVLPKKIIHDVYQTNIPFGKLLSNNQIKVANRDRRYFAIICNHELKSLTHCVLNSTLYGRTNTIIGEDNQQWFAHVVEILPRVFIEDKK